MPPIRFKKKHNTRPKQRPPIHPDDDDAPFDQDAFFREALFQIYGQPLHIYPRPESMDDEMYMEYVKEMMWQNTQEAREEQQQREKQEREWRQERDKLREKERAWKTRHEYPPPIESMDAKENIDPAQRAWERYDQAWIALKNSTSPNPPSKIPWPVLSGRPKDVSRRHVEEFFQSAPPRSTSLIALLKAERVRWHPDKMQQKFRNLDAETLRRVTAVFQDIDRLYATLRG